MEAERDVITMELKKNEIYEVCVTGLSSEGSGVARINDYVIFIPESAVGDILKIKLIKQLKNYGYGRIEEIVTPSNTRIEPDCKVSTQCGGCTYRYISYKAELAHKQELVKNAFERIGKVVTPVGEIIGSANENEYRNKAQFPVSMDKDGEIISGFYAKRSHRIVSCDECKLQTCDFSEIQAFVLNFIKQNNIPVYNEVTNKGLVRHIYIRKAEATGEIMVCIVATNSKIPNENKLVEGLVSLNPNIKSVIINVNDKSTNVILGKRCRTIYGADTITDVMCGVKIAISPLSFYQVNKNQAEVLYKKAIEQASLKKTDVLIDLYCGTGTIGLISASEVRQVIGVEIIPQAIENAQENARLNDIDNVRFICADAKNATVQLLSEGVKPDVVIVDPPRKGLDEQVIEAIVQMSPSRLVMVSCNPATAARDVSLLAQNGYEVKSITPVDMFPRTGHVECVVLMERVKE